MWTIAAYALIFLLLVEFRPSLRAIFNSKIGQITIVWYIILRLLPLFVGFIFLITGYSALKGDKSQIFPSIVHGIALAALLTNLFQAFVFLDFK